MQSEELLEGQTTSNNLQPDNSSSRPSQEDFSYGLTDKIPIFNYLVSSERVGWYRTIMRVFLARHRELYKYQLTAHEIWETLREQFDPTYSLEKCQTDLKVLEEWGNLITTYDASRHTSIQSFRSPALLYQATPLAIALETFLEQQRRVGSALGALRQGDLARLWEIVERLDEWLSNGATSSSLELAEEWRRAFELFSTMARDAAQYLANMISVARRLWAGLEAYQSYKRAVVEYVTNFGQTLAYYSVPFRERLTEWLTGPKALTLIEAVADHLEPPTLQEASRQTREKLVEEAAHQLEALADWFAIGNNADNFRRAAAAEVEKVVRRAEQFATAARLNANYAADLDSLARRLLEATDPEETRQLTLVAFAHGLPGHLPENLAGPGGLTGSQPAWQEPPSVQPILRTLGRLRLDKTVELAISDNRAARQVLIQRRLLERADERARNLAENLAQAQQGLQESQQQRTAAQTVFGLRLAAYPVPRLTEARLLAEKDDYPRAAIRLLNPGSGSTVPVATEESLESEYSRAFNHLNLEYNQERPTLAEYGPELDDQGRMSFVVEDQLEPPGLLVLLAQQIEVQKTLLGQEERSLFEDFLLQEMAEAIRYHIGQTETWVRKINRLLGELPMVGEHYALEWKPGEEGELSSGLGSHIARQHRLLRKPAQALNADEAQVLMEAFRQEIQGLRLRQKEEPGLNFMESLVQIFDYREWFRFSVFITPTGGNRIRLTDRNAGSRSGAEQLFALYVPLFAALAALYDSVAAPGCPRLLALDEAFDKASTANTQRIMEFLALQGFQWIMTGPQVSGVGSGIPASTEYQMMHEKGSLVATAVPFFWIAGQELDRSAGFDKQAD